jgi:BASS family bile acid:Na+ symporter
MSVGGIIHALLSRHFWVTALVMLTMGMFLPGDYSGLRPLVPVLLGGILFFTCLRISLGEVRAALHWQSLRLLAVTVPTRLVLAPLFCWGLTHEIAPAWAGGILLVAASPSGLSSVAFTDLYGGSRMVALLQTLGTSLLCPLTVPLLVAWLGPGQVTGAGMLGQVCYIAALLIVPFFAAQAVRLALPALVRRHDRWWNPGAVLSSTSLIFVGISCNRHAWAGWSPLQLLTPMLLSCEIGLWGLIAGSAARWLMQRGNAIAFSCGELWPNNGLAVAFSTRYFHGDAHSMLPAVLAQLPIIAGIVTFGQLSRVRPPPAAAPAVAGAAPVPPDGGRPAAH